MCSWFCGGSPRRTWGDHGFWLITNSFFFPFFFSCTQLSFYFRPLLFPLLIIHPPSFSLFLLSLTLFLYFLTYNSVFYLTWSSIRDLLPSSGSIWPGKFLAQSPSFGVLRDLLHYIPATPYFISYDRRLGVGCRVLALYDQVNSWRKLLFRLSMEFATPSFSFLVSLFLLLDLLSTSFFCLSLFTLFSFSSF